MTSGENDPQLSARLAIINTLAEQLQNCRWSYHTTLHSLNSPDDLNSITATWTEFSRGRIAIETLTGRHRAEIQKVGRWIDGVTPFIGKEVGFSFDGKAFRTANRYRHGADLPGPTERCFGRVKSQSDDFTSVWGLETGLAFLPPYILTHDSGTQRLTDVLQTKLGKGLSISSGGNEHDEWTIVFPDGLDLVHLTYSVPLGGAVLEATWGAGSPRRVWRRIVADSYHRSAEGFWVPKQVSMVGRLETPPDLMRTEFSDVQYNEDVDDNAFRITFPTGTVIDDEILKQTYMEGQTPEDDQQAVKRFRERHTIPAAVRKS